MRTPDSPWWTPRVTFAGRDARRAIGCSGTRVARGADARRPFMADNPSEVGREDDTLINVNQDHELTYWSRKLGVSRDRLREAVARAGPLVRNVERELRGG